MHICSKENTEIYEGCMKCLSNKMYKSFLYKTCRNFKDIFKQFVNMFLIMYDIYCHVYVSVYVVRKWKYKTGD